MALDFEKIANSIGKTGFKLEYETGNLLRKHGWHLISNRCYIDDLEGTVREMDLLAYKVKSVKDFSLYTALIISCKKNEANSWALLSRAIEEKDPNYNWRPFKGWSDHPALNYYTSKMTWSPSYHEALSGACPTIFAQPEIDVFAFQEISKSNFTCQNDKNIFASITSLMKAQSYEMSILESRKRDKRRVYQFNLISIIDSELIRIFFDNESVSAKPVDSEAYLCRYILNKKEEVARINFVTSEAFPKVLEEYSTLHEKNCEIFEDHYDKFYHDAYKEWHKAKLLLPEFNKIAKPALIRASYRQNKRISELPDVDVSWNDKEKNLTIDIDWETVSIEMLESLNLDKKLRSEIAKALSDVFKYNGEFSFDIGIPF